MHAGSPPTVAPKVHQAAPVRPKPLHVQRLIGARYQLINDLGRGATGSVHRVLDRLTGRVVTLKRVRLRDTPDSRSDDPWRSNERLTLAREFRVLSSLHHPNIISVLDYGFDEQHPYLTMDLEENARTILEAARAEPLAMQVELLVQTLRALVYLHRHGVIHRDLKPENVLVVGDQVKVLDFGLSIRRDGFRMEDSEPAGTILYMAPELLYGDPPSERSDLWAMGIIAYELLCGEHPFARTDPMAFYRELTHTTLPRPTDPVDPRLRPILARLLAVKSADRFEDATQVIGALEQGLGLHLAVETVATRESFLQAAPLVGRQEELATLSALLRSAAAGHGGAWLIGGESGVGKSRLLDELRTQALVAGVIVVRGQGVSQGGSPYHVWRDVLRNLILRVDPSDGDASVLKAVVPDIGDLLGREIEESLAFNPETTQSRLLLAVEEVVRRQRGTVLVILEDLQWVGSESLRLLDWLAQSAERLPLLLLGTFRNDEAPELPRAVESVRVMKLGRLERADIAALAESMIGPAGCDADVAALLERETEGIPFFVVEVVRALAEHAGGLSRIGRDQLPIRVVSGGMRRVVRRRLGRVQPEAIPPLETAAVLGRTLDLNLLRALHPDLRIDD